ncbi:hypothetical protein, partial [Vreelandella rituensis]|uniref:hypothetical protein n=1 Tax=Vreelandella rituensis TaxID=2282306 RepID=UPI0039EFD1A7
DRQCQGIEATDSEAGTWEVTTRESPSTSALALKVGEDVKLPVNCALQWIMGFYGKFFHKVWKYRDK